MRKFIATAACVLSCLALLLIAPPAAAGDGCYICSSGSSNGCKQCRYGSSDTSAARKACRAKGCKVGGTTSCSTAANVKVCKASTSKKSWAYFTLELANAKL